MSMRHQIGIVEPKELDKIPQHATWNAITEHHRNALPSLGRSPLVGYCVCRTSARPGLNDDFHPSILRASLGRVVGCDGTVLSVSLGFDLVGRHALANQILSDR